MTQIEEKAISICSLDCVGIIGGYFFHSQYSSTKKEECIQISKPTDLSSRLIKSSRNSCWQVNFSCALTSDSDSWSEMLRVRLKILKITSKKCPQDSNKYLKTLQTDSSLTFKFSYNLALSIYDFIAIKGVAVVFSINVRARGQQNTASSFRSNNQHHFFKKKK